MLTKTQKMRLGNAVERGITKIIREKGIEEFRIVDLNTLEMGSGDSCMIGQLHGWYAPEEYLNIKGGSRFGFDVPGNYGSKESEAYDYLTVLWTRKVQQIRTALERLSKRFGG